MIKFLLLTAFPVMESEAGVPVVGAVERHGFIIESAVLCCKQNKRLI